MEKQPEISVMRRYNWNDVPTLKNMYYSNIRHQFAMGPFGSGKTSALITKVLRYASEQSPSPDGIRRSRWAVVRNCYDDKTEILTEKRGWQLFRDLVLPGDRVATLQNEKIVYEEPNAVAVFPYKGEMIGFENEGIDFFVTPDHELLVSTRRTRKKVWGEFERVKAELVYGSQLVRMRRDAEWEGVDIGLNEDVFEWLGFWFAEGSINKHQTVISTINGVEYTKNLFLRANLSYRRTGNQFIVTNEIKEIWSLIKNAGKAGVKEISQEIMSAPRSHIGAFLKGFTKGDGNIYKNTVRLYTSSKIMADQLQELALKAGITANIARRDRIGKVVIINGSKGRVNYPEFAVTLLGEKKLRPILQVNPKMTNHLRGWYKQDYDGLVYCAEMPFPVVVVRRNGKSSMNTRTYPQLKDTTIKTVKFWLPEGTFDGLSNVWKEVEHNYYINVFPGIQLELMFRALDRPDHVANLLSMEITAAVLNEFREISKDIFEAIDGRIGRYPSVQEGGCKWYGILGDSNPPSDRSYWYKLFEKIKPKNLKVWKQPSGLSPKAENTANLPKNYYQNLAQGKDKAYVDVYIHGKYGYLRTGKPIFELYNDNDHVANTILEPIPDIPIGMGWDFALHPTCVLGQVLRGRLHVLDCIMGEDMGIRRMIDNLLMPQLQIKYRGYKFVGLGDTTGTARAPTDETTCYGVLKEKGFGDIKPMESNAITPRLEAVNYFLDKKDGFFISPQLSFLREAMSGGYCFKAVPGKNDEWMDEPDKNIYSHAADALQALCTFYTGKRTNRDKDLKLQAMMQRQMYRPADTIAGY